MERPANRFEQCVPATVIARAQQVRPSTWAQRRCCRRSEAWQRDGEATNDAVRLSASVDQLAAHPRER